MFSVGFMRFHALQLRSVEFLGNPVSTWPWICIRMLLPTVWLWHRDTCHVKLVALQTASKEDQAGSAFELVHLVDLVHFHHFVHFQFFYLLQRSFPSPDRRCAGRVSEMRGRQLDNAWGKTVRCQSCRPCPKILCSKSWIKWLGWSWSLASTSSARVNLWMLFMSSNLENWVW